MAMSAPSGERDAGTGLLPVSVKAVIFDDQGRVLLGLNDRSEWELPGGRMNAGESPQECVVREVREETGIEVAVEGHLGEWPFEVIPRHQVLISAYACRLLALAEPVSSSEHDEVRYWPLAALDELRLPEVYKHAVSLAQKSSATWP